MSTSIITNRINKLKELLVEFGTVKNDIKSAISNKLSVQAGEPVEAGRNMSYWVEFINSLEVSQYSDMAGMCYSFSTITEFPEGWKFAPRTENHAEQMFSYCSYLTTIPQLDTSEAISFMNMFNFCPCLTTIPQLDTSKGTSFMYMFQDCYSLTTIPQLDTSKGISFGWMFSRCESLTTIPQLDTSKGRDFGSMFYDCAKLTTLGGFVGLGKNLDLSYSPNLTHDSLMNVINNLATVTSSTTLTLGSTNLAKLTDEEKKVATDKGWTLA
jgi:hypothetical protein